MQRSTIIRAIRRPESAAVAGLIFAVILGAALALLEQVTSGAAGETAWVGDDQRRSQVSLALTLVAFAGIAFLWFIAVIRAHLGAPGDRFFEIVFLGSGLVFVSTLFTAASALKAVLLLDAAGEPLPASTVAFAWAFATSVLGVFGAKMAAVFTFSAATAGVRAGSLPRWLALLGYLTGLTMLAIPPLPDIVQFLFPLWVACVSVLILVRRRRIEGPVDETPSGSSGQR